MGIKNIDLTIMIPTYNSASTIGDLLWSIIEDSQSPKAENIKVQILVVDDGSTDDTLDIVRKLTQQFPENVTLIKNKHGGASAARNTGIKNAQGDYILFFDSDDEWQVGFFENLGAELQRLDFPQVVFFNSPLFKKFTLSRDSVVELLNLLGDTSSEIPCIQAGVIGNLYSNSFIAEEGLTFDTSLRTGEDVLLNVEAILSANSVGVSKLSNLSYSGEHAIARVSDKNLLNERKFNREIYRTVIKENPYNTSFGYNINDDFSLIYLRYCLNGLTFLIDRYLYGQPLAHARDKLAEILSIREYHMALRLYPRIKGRIHLPTHSKIIVFFVRQHLFPLSLLFIRLNNLRKKTQSN